MQWFSDPDTLTGGNQTAKGVFNDNKTRSIIHMASLCRMTTETPYRL